MLTETRHSWRSALSGVTMLGLAAGAGTTATSVTTASVSPAQAQSLLVTPSVVVPPPPAEQPRTFTKVECKGIALVASEVVKAIGANKLSLEFRQSFVNWVRPPAFTCDGPKDILTPRGDDIDTFNVIRRVLLAGKNPISLQKAGLRSVDPKDIDAARRPGVDKKSDAGKPPVAAPESRVGG